jgi:hypothetical protein
MITLIKKNIYILELIELKLSMTNVYGYEGLLVAEFYCIALSMFVQCSDLIA